MPSTWDEYLTVSQRDFVGCHQKCHGAFEKQRLDIQHVFQATDAKSVACFGAGALNDIPYMLLVHSDVSIHLVDWIEGSIDAGIDMSVIQSSKDGRPSCLYCHPNVACPAMYCRHYNMASPNTRPVCDNFAPVPGDRHRCGAYQRGELPWVHYEDVTAGYASAFGRQVLDELKGIRSWKQALARAAALADRIRPRATPTTIADESVDLVTSSMLLSQFDHEPYDYFSSCAANILGPPTVEEEERLGPATESLRTTLLINQIDRHCREIRRILTSGGCCYMSFELFHTLPSSNHSFLVHNMARALDYVGRYFFFNFDVIPSHEMVTRFQTDDNPSLVFSFVLEPKELIGN